MTYYYTSVGSGGYRWNMLQRIFNTVGIEPTETGDVGEQTYVKFTRELTEAEKTLLDGVMADNPTYPPEPNGTRFVIIDVWNRRSEIITAMGIEYKVYYSESVPGSGDVDQIELHFNKTLTTQERNKVASEYQKLITLK